MIKLNSVFLVSRLLFLVICDPFVVILMSSLLLHSSKLCDLIRSIPGNPRDKIRVHINRTCPYFKEILDYMYTGYVNLPGDPKDVYVWSDGFVTILGTAYGCILFQPY